MTAGLARRHERAWTLGILSALAVLALLPLARPRDDTLNFVFVILLSLTMAQSWNIVAGYAGQVNLGHAAFFGIGALVARTLWIGVGIGSQELCSLHDDLEPPLLDLGCYRREERKYTPHITLGRVKSGRPSDKLPLALAKHAGWKGGEIIVPEVLVLSSELTPKGPIYTVLSRAKLSS